jgi:hypothetical protein
LPLSRFRPPLRPPPNSSSKTSADIVSPRRFTAACRRLECSNRSYAQFSHHRDLIQSFFSDIKRFHQTVSTTLQGRNCRANAAKTLCITSCLTLKNLFNKLKKYDFLFWHKPCFLAGQRVCIQLVTN